MSIKPLTRGRRARLSRAHRRAISKGLIAYYDGLGRKETAGTVVGFKPRKLKPVLQEKPATVHETPAVKAQRVAHALGHPSGTFDSRQAHPATHKTAVERPGKSWYHQAMDEALRNPKPKKKSWLGSLFGKK